MPRTEIERVEELLERFQSQDDMGIYSGSENLLVPMIDHLVYYQMGLRCLPMEFAFTSLTSDKALDFFCEKLKEIGGYSHWHLAQYLHGIAKDDAPENWNMDNYLGSLSAKLFRALESYLVLEVMSAPVFKAIKEFIDSQKVCVFSVHGDLVTSLKVRHSRTLEILSNKSDDLFANYRSLVENDNVDDSLLEMAWHQWQYPKGLPEGHPVFDTINKFKELFCKQVASE